MLTGIICKCNFKILIKISRKNGIIFINILKFYIYTKILTHGVEYDNLNKVIRITIKNTKGKWRNTNEKL